MSVYKKEKPEYLDMALTSIEQQTIIPKEIVLVEDGPISNLMKQVIGKHKEFFGDGFKEIISSKNNGLGAALRLGTDYVTTNWIARMDSDDISVSNRFELQLNAIKRNPNIGLIGGQVLEFKNDVSNVVGKRNVPLKKKDIYNFVKWRSPFNHPTVFIKKDLLNKVGGYMSFGNLEDYFLWARIINGNYEIENINNVLVYMRVSSGMYSRRGKLSNLSYFYRLRRYMYEHHLISLAERYLSNILMTINIIIPNWLRAWAYRHLLHNVNK